MTSSVDHRDGLTTPPQTRLRMRTLFGACSQGLGKEMDWVA